MATLADLMIRIGIDADRVRKGSAKVVDTINKNFMKLDAVAGKAIKTMAGVSSVAPLAAGAAGGVLALGASFAAAGAAAGVFGAVLTSTVGEVSENATKYEDLTEKIRLYGRQAEIAGKYGLEAGDYALKQSKAMMELEARLSLLPPAERKATMAFIGMKNSWKDFVDDNKPATFSFLEKGYSLIGTVVGKLQPLYDIGAQAADRFLGKMQRMVDGGFIERLTARAGPALNSLTTILMNVGTVIGKVFGKMGDAQGQKMLDWIETMSFKWAAWANSDSSDSGINAFIDYMTENGPKLLKLLSDISAAVLNIMKAISPFAPLTLAVASALTTLLAAVPPEVLTALVAAYLAWSVALKAYAAWQTIATAVQWAQNTAMWAWPGTWIIAGILALIAVIILIATKTTWFQQIWDAVWGFLKMVGAWFAGPFSDFFISAGQKIWGFFKMIGAWFAGPFAQFFVNLWNKVRNAFRTGIENVKSFGRSFIQFWKDLGSKISGVLSKLWNPLQDGFKRVVNWVINKWNGLSFKIPQISVFGQTFGGGTIGVPNIPQLARGALVKSRQGGTLVNVGEGGEDEAVVPLSKMPDIAQSREQRTVVVQIMPGGELEFRRWINKTVRVKGPVGNAG